MHNKNFSKGTLGVLCFELDIYQGKVETSSEIFWIFSHFYGKLIECRKRRNRRQ